MGRKLPRILITAGPTREYLDPTRFISNPSSGRMGLDLAQEAKRRGCSYKLILGPSSLSVKGIQAERIISAEDLFKKVKKYFLKYDVLIMAAAVSDYRPVVYSKRKIKKKENSRLVKLVLNPDILSWAGRNKKKQIVVGFSAETHHIIANALKKLKKKNSDIIVANRVGVKEVGFNSEDIQYSILEAGVKDVPLCKTSKKELSRILIEKVIQRFQTWK